ncbi:DNA alkylation repair protein [Stigmatella sp. ncwal1]|uniref:DNA alkylation repair protein n=1 Tax=Stigmatella ashevillensis TaxID=2995309 RepID=A0ABT5DGC5_9BACT|nr:DNA alkylation repair protein [Stigmatella ashevillena]MDC0712153.1 DNA alkylation repair protein [Stigmatella ashevillena]
MSAETIQRELAQSADAAKAAFYPRFFKTGPGEYAEGDRFLGVTVPLQRRIARRHRDTPLPELAKLVGSPIHEHRLTGFLILIGQYRQADEAVRERLHAFCLRHLASLNNWDLVDTVAPHLLGEHLVLHPERRSMLFDWVRSPSLWKRRIAIMATHAFVRKGDFADALALAERLLGDPEDLIHKAVGWTLREVGTRALALEEAFLERHAGQMPRTMLRYAIEKFPPARRRYFMER